MRTVEIVRERLQPGYTHQPGQSSVKFLGVHYGHNATVCLMENGRITFCQSEERLNRLKNSTGFPFLTLDHLYRHVVAPHEIDAAVLYQRSISGYKFLKSNGFKPVQHAEYFQSSFVTKRNWKRRILRTELGWKLREAKRAAPGNRGAVVREAHQFFATALRLPEDRVHYIDHHLGHAYSTVPNVASQPKTLIFTLDAEGDGICGTVSVLHEGKLTVLSRNNYRNSLGYYYSATTRIMGMKPGEHEYKVMGLAPYANPTAYSHITDRLHHLLEVTRDGRWRSRPNPEMLISALLDAYRMERFDNIAGAIQELTENLVTRWIRYWIERTECHDIAVAGGVFMNVKLSQRVLALPQVAHLFVMPSAADESCPIGGVAWLSSRLDTGRPLEPLRDLYLGMTFDDREIEKAVAEGNVNSRYVVSRPANMTQAIAQLLSSNEIVARCTGRMEWGARALGNRSILANPSDFLNVRRINDAIKNRDFWMPFTPSILEDDMARYVVNCDRIFAPYMAITFDSTSEARHDLQGAMHPRDFTIRPQCVRRDWNPAYYDIIAAFRERTGIGAVLNTSFNLHGEPVVCSPADAIRTADRSGLRYLSMGGYLLEKKNPQELPLPVGLMEPALQSDGRDSR